MKNQITIDSKIGILNTRGRYDWWTIIGMPANGILLARRGVYTVVHTPTVIDHLQTKRMKHRGTNRNYAV